MSVISLIDTTLFLFQIGILLIALYACVHAILQRADAYMATEHLTKQTWVSILVLGVILGFIPFYGYFQIMGSVIAMCAAGLYLADVRPRLLEVQGKTR